MVVLLWVWFVCIPTWKVGTRKKWERENNVAGLRDIAEKWL